MSVAFKDRIEGTPDVTHPPGTYPASWPWPVPPPKRRTVSLGVALASEVVGEAAYGREVIAGAGADDAKPSDSPTRAPADPRCPFDRLLIILLGRVP